MADWVDLSIGASSLALLSVTGVIPRVGIVRALMLGWRSYFQTINPLSVRKSEVNKLNKSIICLLKGRYIVVTGGKGIGKSCLIDTTLNRHHGVVKISVSVLPCYCLFM